MSPYESCRQLMWCNLVMVEKDVAVVAKTSWQQPRKEHRLSDLSTLPFSLCHSTSEASNTLKAPSIPTQMHTSICYLSAAKLGSFTRRALKPQSLLWMEGAKAVRNERSYFILVVIKYTARTPFV